MQRNEIDADAEVLSTIKKVLLFAFIGIIASVILFGCFYKINAGERGVILKWGEPDLVAKSPGLHVKMPIRDKVIKMDIQTQKYEAELTAASQDLQDVNTKIAINYHIVPEDVPIIYRDIGLNYAEKVVYPLEQEANKAVTAKFTAEQLVTKREAVKEQMESLLSERLRPRGIIVEEISIINFQFSGSFTQAIEAKVTAEQNALAAKNKLAQVEYEAQQRITQANAEAEAIRIQAQSINSQGGADYVQLQAINKWNGQLPTYTGGGVIPFINVNNGQSVQGASA